MPLIVKIPNPHHRRKQGGEDSSNDSDGQQQQQQAALLGVDEGGDDGGYRTAASTLSPSPSAEAAALLATGGEPDSSLVQQARIYPTLPEVDGGIAQMSIDSEAAAAAALMTMSHDAPAPAPGVGIGSATPSFDSPVASTPSPPHTPAIVSPPSQSQPPLLDIIVAPAVLAHRYVRGRDVSLIVERPERIRACLLGVASLLGRIAAGELQEGRQQQAGQQQQGGNDDDDDLVSRLAGMSVDRQAGDGMEQQQQAASTSSLSTPLQVLHSTRSVSLASHPAVRAVHAIEGDEEEDLVDCLPTAYEQKKAARRKQRQADAGEAEASPSSQQQQTSSRQPFVDYLSHLCTAAPHEPPHPPPPKARGVRGAASATATPTLGGRTRSSILRGGGGNASASTSAAATPVISPSRGATKSGGTGGGIVHFGDVKKEHGDDGHAGHMPAAAAAMTPSTSHDNAFQKATTQKEDDSSSSDSDDDLQHASEVPEHLSQGDLYLRGSRTAKREQGLQGEDDTSLYGSREAMEHAVGATIEAVDRVMRASAGAQEQASISSPGSSRGTITPLIFSTPSHAPSPPLTATPPSRRSLVLTRPPGHHCSSTAPSGFCWINNVAIAAQHAYQLHGVDRVVILDVDLHHGNGTQKIVWRINEEAERLDREREARIVASRKTSPAKRRGAAGAAVSQQQQQANIPPRALRICYASLHDIESYPCEDGSPTLVRDASTTINGAHGQWISNAHLDSYSSSADFHRLYTTQYRPALLGHARRFLERTAADPAKTLVLISCGFDACEHEMQGMQRHGKRVPVGFYRRVATDVAMELAGPYAMGRVVTLLEGGYGDRALLSGVVGLGLGFLEAGEGDERSGQKEASAVATTGMDPYDHAWFGMESLKATEKLLAPHHAGAASRRGAAAAAATPAWLQQTEKAFAQFETLCRPLMGSGPAAMRRR